MRLLTNPLLCLLLLVAGTASAQTDSLTTTASPEPTTAAAAPSLFTPPPATPQTPFAPSKRVDRHTSTKAYRMTYVSVPLIVGGVVMMSYDKSFAALRNGHAQSFRHDFDDYLQYAPMGATYILKICGVKGRSSWGRMLVSHAFSAALMATAVNSLKYSVKIERPDGSGRNSFPSGHTATAFMAATMLHKEYGQRSPWYSIGGYSVATLVGVARQLNNRHWMSDVMVGAGIGILTTELGYFLADLIFKDRGLLYASDGLYAFDRYRHPSFMGIDIAFSTVAGRYHPFAGQEVTFSTGPTVNVQGAWFMSPYLGIGGRFGVSNINLKVNGVAQTETLSSIAGYMGAYFSYPMTARWLMGGKLLGGYEYYKSCMTDGGELGNRGGGAFGMGSSLTYIASQNLGVRFTMDYDLAPPMVDGSRERLSRLTFGLGVSAQF